MKKMLTPAFSYFFHRGDGDEIFPFFLFFLDSIYHLHKDMLAFN